MCLCPGPLDTPTNLQILGDTKNSTYAEFTWHGVDTNVERVQGFFRGYRVNIHCHIASVITSVLETKTRSV